MFAQSPIDSIHQRGELSILMTQLGHPLPTLDILLQFTVERGKAWPLPVG